MAAVFGTGISTNAYFSAFALPDFIYSFLVYGAVSSAFIPIFTELKNKDRWKFTSSIIVILLVLTILSGAILFLFADQFTYLVFPGFGAEEHTLTTELLRILVLSPILFSISAIMGSVQTALGNFRAYALAPLLYNASIIFGIVYFRDIHMVAWMTVAGAALHALIQLIAVWRKGFYFSPKLKETWQRIKEFFVLALPRIFAIVTTQLNLVVDASIASLVPFGSLAVLRYAQDLNSFPLGIVGLSVATSSFGVLSSLASRGNILGFANLIKRQLTRILYFIIPAAVGLILIRTEITSLILKGGEFTSEDVTHTSITLSWLAIGLIGSATIPLLARAFYSLKNTRLPLYAAVTSVFINLILDLLLYKTYGIYGLAIASSFAAITQAGLLLYWLCKKTSWRQIISLFPIFEIIFSTLAMGLVIYGTSVSWPTPEKLDTISSFIRVLTFVFISMAIYFSSTIFTGTFKKIWKESN